MPSYVSPLRDLQFALTDLLDVPATLAAMPECADADGLCSGIKWIRPVQDD
jgi:hypothetical protein